MWKTLDRAISAARVIHLICASKTKCICVIHVKHSHFLTSNLNFLWKYNSLRAANYCMVQRTGCTRIKSLVPTALMQFFYSGNCSTCLKDCNPKRKISESQFSRDRPRKKLQELHFSVVWFVILKINWTEFVFTSFNSRLLKAAFEKSGFFWF